METPPAGEEGLREMGRATEVAETSSIEQLLFNTDPDSAAAADSAAAVEEIVGSGLGNRR